MVKEIYVNLPVKDLKKSMDFFATLGFTFNPLFTDENAAGMILGENMHCMLLGEKFWSTFTDKKVCDTTTTIEVMNALESRQDVDDMVKKAVAAGGKEPRPAQEHGWMYSRSFEDLDGHTWEAVWTDISKFPKK